MKRGPLSTQCSAESRRWWGSLCVCQVISRDLAVRGVIKFIVDTGQARRQVSRRPLCAWLEASGKEGLPREETTAGSAGGGPLGLQKVNSNLAISFSKTLGISSVSGLCCWLQPSEQIMKVH